MASVALLSRSRTSIGQLAESPRWSALTNEVSHKMVSDMG
jgi:hypothetical protein